MPGGHPLSSYLTGAVSPDDPVAALEAIVIDRLASLLKNLVSTDDQKSLVFIDRIPK